MDDPILFQGQRKRLIVELRQKGITDERVLSAMERVPRQHFMEKGLAHLAYQDKPFPIGEGQTISQPYTVAMQTHLLDVQPRHRVLEIGTGSGYQAAILAEMGAIVFSVERHYPLFRTARKRFTGMDYALNLFHGDGFAGLPAYAPFDRILVTCGVASVPAQLAGQLACGGKMVIPLGPSDYQVMTLLSKTADGDFVGSEHGLYSFVPMLEGRILPRRPGTSMNEAL